MEKKKSKSGFLKRLRHKYRLIIYNDNTFEEVFWIRLNRLNAFIALGLLSFLLILLTTVLIAYTPLREFIPGYPTGETVQMIRMNSLMVDSLENEIYLRDVYMDNLKALINGEEPRKIDRKAIIDSLKNYKNIDLKPTNDDSLFRKQVESEDAFSVDLKDKDSKAEVFNLLHFFFPVKGMVTDKFNLRNKHFGIDIVTKPDEMVLSTLDGTITFSGWTLETGYMVEIQHPNELISAYKHLSHVFKTAGTKVKAGEVIGIVGNTGELTTGPHLHFELWYKGNPINAEDFIVF
jgi:murein DD-endopeptidase MepM/ murein hydrolase activator NlpD